MSVRRAPGLLAAVAIALTVGVGACTDDPNSVAAQAKAGDQKGYVSGDGSVEQIAADQRKDPIKLSGKTVDGASWDLADVKDRVVVVNVWGSWCAPCVAEAPHLQKVWAAKSKAGEPVQFIGIDFREGPERGQSFARRAGLTYPSLSDESGVQILALQGQAPTVPTTLVLDRQHRIAARVNGPVNETTLTGLIDDVVKAS